MQAERMACTAPTGFLYLLGSFNAQPLSRNDGCLLAEPELVDIIADSRCK